MPVSCIKKKQKLPFSPMCETYLAADGVTDCLRTGDKLCSTLVNGRIIMGMLFMTNQGKA